MERKEIKFIEVKAPEGYKLQYKYKDRLLDIKSNSIRIIEEDKDNIIITKEEND